MNKYQGGFFISQIKQMSGRLFNQILSSKNIDAFNGEQGRILYILWQKDHVSIRELSDCTGLAVTTMTSMLDRMEKSALIIRKPDINDRRKTLIALTDEAKLLKKDYDEVSLEMGKLFYEGFDEEEILECEEYLKRILENIKKNIG